MVIKEQEIVFKLVSCPLARLSGSEEDEDDYEELEAVLHSKRKVRGQSHIIVIIKVCIHGLPSRLVHFIIMMIT